MTYFFLYFWQGETVGVYKCPWPLYFQGKVLSSFELLGFNYYINTPLSTAIMERGGCIS